MTSPLSLQYSLTRYDVHADRVHRLAAGQAEGEYIPPGQTVEQAYEHPPIDCLFEVFTPASHLAINFPKGERPRERVNALAAYEKLNGLMDKEDLLGKNISITA